MKVVIDEKEVRKVIEWWIHQKGMAKLANGNKVKMILERDNEGEMNFFGYELEVEDK